MQHHRMSLFESPYDRIRSGLKTVEVRLNDAKRQKVKEGDLITFSRLPEKIDELCVKVRKINQYDSFRDLLNDTPMYKLGRNSTYDKDNFLNSIYDIYSKEKEEEFGVLGIEIELL